MDFATESHPLPIMLVKVVLPLILAFIMFSLGLGLRRAYFARVLKFPVAFGTGLVNQLLLLPIIAYVIVVVFKLSPEMAVSVMILSFCPGGVTSNVLTRMANGNTPLSISLTAITSLLAIFTVPLLVAFFVQHFMGTEGPKVNVTSLGMTMFLLTAVPVGLGMILTANAPRLVEKISKVVSRIALVLFVLIIVAALAKNRVVFFGNLPTLGPALILLNLIMLGLGIATAKLLKLDTKDAHYHFTGVRSSKRHSRHCGGCLDRRRSHRDTSPHDRCLRRLRHHHVFCVSPLCLLEKKNPGGELNLSSLSDDAPPCAGTIRLCQRAQRNKRRGV